MNSQTMKFLISLLADPADGPKSIYTGDVDGDGDLDVVHSGSIIAWYENLGPTGFAAPIQITIVDTHQMLPSVAWCCDRSAVGPLSVRVRRTASPG